MQFTGMRPDAIRSIRHRWLLKCWNELRRDRKLPEWSCVDADDIARSLDTITLIDLVGNGGARRFRIHFQGALITEAYGRDCSGSFLDEVQPPATRPATLAVFTHASKVIRPVYTIAELQDPAGRPVQTERLLLPFALDKGLRFLSALETFSPEGAFVRRGLLTAPPAPRYLVCATVDPHPP